MSKESLHKDKQEEYTMRHKWKRLLLTTMAVGMLSSVTAFAANVSMNLFYNGKNHAYNAKEIVVKIDGKDCAGAWLRGYLERRSQAGVCGK